MHIEYGTDLEVKFNNYNDKATLKKPIKCSWRVECINIKDENFVEPCSAEIEINNTYPGIFNKLTTSSAINYICSQKTWDWEKVYAIRDQFAAACCKCRFFRCH